MKKRFGFTLAETLITLGIIGIIMAILIPALSKAKPDGTKAMYLKVYDSLTTTVKNLGANSGLFQLCNNPDEEMTIDEGGQVNCHKYPFLNTSQPSSKMGAHYSNDNRFAGDGKFCNLLADSLGIAEADTHCPADDVTYAFDAAAFDSAFTTNADNFVTFKTQNGVQWKVSRPVTRSINWTTGTARWQQDIYVDVNGSNSPNCIYNADSCTNPDRFKFEVYADGEVVAADPMGQAFLNSRRLFAKKDITIPADAAISDTTGNKREKSVEACNLIPRELVLTIKVEEIDGDDEHFNITISPESISNNTQITDYIEDTLYLCCSDVDSQDDCLRKVSIDGQTRSIKRAVDSDYLGIIPKHTVKNAGSFDKYYNQYFVQTYPNEPQDTIYWKSDSPDIWDEDYSYTLVMSDGTVQYTIQLKGDQTGEHSIPRL